jgi:Domain of unknown function (DUF4328)
MPCPRCGHVSDAAGGPFCPRCGRYLATLQWVAEPPASTVPEPPLPRPSRYIGPPHYAEPQRWGFPAAPWPGAVIDPDRPAQPVPPEQRARSLAAVAGPLLWALAAVALLAAGAETWRYVLLLASREGALSADAVAASDALVLAAGTGTVLLGLAAGGVVVGWSLPAAAAAAARSNSLPSRSWREIVLGWVVPGWNLAVAGPVLAEIEHGALDRAPDRRPQPSRLVGLWWLLWVAGGVLTAIALVWSWRTGVQARADGVLLHALLDLLAAVTAGVTAVLVGRLTVLLNPVRAPRRRLLLAVGDRRVRQPAAAPATPA